MSCRILERHAAGWRELMVLEIDHDPLAMVRAINLMVSRITGFPYEVGLPEGAQVHHQAP